MSDDCINPFWEFYCRTREEPFLNRNQYPTDGSIQLGIFVLPKNSIRDCIKQSIVTLFHPASKSHRVTLD